MDFEELGYYLFMDSQENKAGAPNITNRCINPFSFWKVEEPPKDEIESKKNFFPEIDKY